MNRKGYIDKIEDFEVVESLGDLKEATAMERRGTVNVESRESLLEDDDDSPIKPKKKNKVS